MKPLQLVRQSLALALLASVPLAQRSVWVVDWKGGPGADYTDLNEAFWATGDGDVLLLRPGYYNFFGIADDRALTMVADGPGVDLHTSNILIRNLSAEKRVVLRGLTLTYGSIHCEDNEGIVWIEDCNVVADQYGGSSEIAALVAWNTKLVLRDGFLRGSIPYGFHNTPPTDGLSLSGSIAWIHGVSIYGGDGQDTIYPDFPGADGIAAYSSTFAVSNSFLHGGSGFSQPGGDGLVLSSSSTWTRACSLGGGSGTPQGQGLTVDGSSEWTPTARASPRLVTSSPVREGELVTLTVHSVPGDVVVLKAGLRPALDLMGAGAFRLVDALPSLTVVLGVVPPDGTLTYSTSAPDLGAASAMELFLQTRHMAYVSERASAPHVPSQAAGPGSSVLLLGPGF